jgi:hypothetical protein
MRRVRVARAFISPEAASVPIFTLITGRWWCDYRDVTIPSHDLYIATDL